MESKRIALICALLFLAVATFYYLGLFQGGDQQPESAPTQTAEQEQAGKKQDSTPGKIDSGILKQPERRLVLMSLHVDHESHHQKAMELLDRAAASGYNRIVIDDILLQKYALENTGPGELVLQFRKKAELLGLKLCPYVFAPSHLLYIEPNLAAGMQVKEQKFIVRNGKAAPANSGKNLLTAGDFEQQKNNSGWDLLSNAVADNGTQMSGNRSLMVSANGFAYKQLALEPFREYMLKAYVKTEQLTKPSDVFGYKLRAYDSEGKKIVPSWVKWDFQPTQNWTEYTVAFNTLDNPKINLYVGVFGNATGTAWFDDVSVEELGLQNVLRTDSCPIIVSAQDGTLYGEGSDYETIYDPYLGAKPCRGAFDFRHYGPEIAITQESRIKDGETLMVSYCHAAQGGFGAVYANLAEPRIEQVMEQQVRNYKNVLNSSCYVLAYDEIRVQGWESNNTNLTPGQVLAENTRKGIDIINRIDPGSEIYAWSDMFDPFHSARDGYYHVRGTWAGSWEGLGNEVIVLNWNSGANASRSLDWFSALGHSQVLAGYYDGSAPGIGHWLGKAKNRSAVVGWMFTTWKMDYSELESFAEQNANVTCAD